MDEVVAIWNSASQGLKQLVPKISWEVTEVTPKIDITILPLKSSKITIFSFSAITAPSHSHVLSALSD